MSKTRESPDPRATAGLATASASDVKKLGWRGILERARRNDGRLTITNHDRAQAVVLTVETFEQLVAGSQRSHTDEEQQLAALRARFDEQLASLQGPDAAAGLRRAIDATALHGKVKAGETC